MSRIDDLIALLSPNGVAVRKLDEVAQIKGRNVQPSAMGKGAVTVYSLPSFDLGKVPENLDGNMVGSAKTRLSGPCILVAKLNPHIPRVWRLESIAENSYCSPEFYPLVPDQDFLDLGYLYFFVFTKMAWLSGTVTGSTNSHKRLHREDFLKLRIPVPPLEVQREIVRILDAFSKLEAELEAELGARRRQYSFYRNQLLTSGAMLHDWTTLGKVASINRGTAITQKTTTQGVIPVVANGPAPTYFHGLSNRSGETIVVARSGAYAGLVSFWNQPIFLTDAFSIHPLDSVLRPKFLYYLMQHRQESIHSMKKGAGVPHVRAKEFESMKIPVPSLEEQTRIVAILDTFDALVNDLSIGLPAELTARRKQYEHYRNRLLTFKELPA